MAMDLIFVWPCVYMCVQNSSKQKKKQKQITDVDKDNEKKNSNNNNSTNGNSIFSVYFIFNCTPLNWMHMPEHINVIVCCFQQQQQQKFYWLINSNDLPLLYFVLFRCVFDIQFFFFEMQGV